MKEHYLLGEVAKILGRKPHQITHLLATGKIPEPAMRIANKRLFTTEDIGRLTRHFGVSPNWEAIEPVPADADADTSEHLTLRPPFDVNQVGETCHEIRDGGGEIFGWAWDRGHALILAGLLEAAARG
jgi:MerR HTH family regulatory protein